MVLDYECRGRRFIYGNVSLFVGKRHVSFRYWSGVVGIAPHVSGGTTNILGSLGLLPHPANLLTLLGGFLLPPRFAQEIPDGLLTGEF